MTVSAQGSWTIVCQTQGEYDDQLAAAQAHPGIDRIVEDAAHLTFTCDVSLSYEA